MPELSRDEQEVLDTYRRARGLGFAEIAIAFEDGLLKKLWLTEKKDPAKLKGMTRIRENA
jgi:hypothetical protein